MTGSQHFPHVKSYVRAHDVNHGLVLEKAGATAVVPETLEPSLQVRLSQSEVMRVRCLYPVNGQYSSERAGKGGPCIKLDRSEPGTDSGLYYIFIVYRLSYYMFLL